MSVILKRTDTLSITIKSKESVLMDKFLLLFFSILLLSGCGIKTKMQKGKVEQASYESHYEQYLYGQEMQSHHQDVKNLQYKIDQLMNDMNKD